MIDQLNDYLRTGPTAAHAVLDLVPYFVEWVEKAVESYDDDDDNIGLLLDRCAGLLEAAAESAEPDG